MADGVSIIDFLRYLITHQNDSNLQPRIDNIRTKIIINDKLISVFIMKNINDSIEILAEVENYSYSFTKHDNFYKIEKYLIFSVTIDAEEKISILINDILEYDDTALVLKYGRFMIKNMDTNRIVSS